MNEMNEIWISNEMLKKKNLNFKNDGAYT